MWVYRLLHGGGQAGALLVGMIAAEGSAHAQSDADMNALNQRVIELYRAGRYGEAIPFAERFAEAMKARHGSDHPAYATAHGSRQPSTVILLNSFTWADSICLR